VRTLIWLPMLAWALGSGSATAEPVKLKLSFFTSDRSVAYVTAIKPFVDAVNLRGKDLVQIEVYLSGSLGAVQRELPRLVLGGGADMAFIVPGQNPELFGDTAVIQLPGLFRDVREATLIYTRLLAARALAGYGDFLVVGAYATDPETIHSRKRMAALADLRGQKIRANNATEAAGLSKLGAVSAVLAFNETSPAISSGAIDGATAPVAQLFDVGIGRLVSNHYLLRTSAAPLTLMMDRKVFEGLPSAAQALIRSYSGEWSAARYIEAFAGMSDEATARLRSDERRAVTAPTASDLSTARRAFKSVIDEWAESSPHSRELVTLVETELAKIRAAE
jgi:TRAP-type C4-dicarboxylate transport system substrate-binding protein